MLKTNLILHEKLQVLFDQNQNFSEERSWWQKNYKSFLKFVFAEAFADDEEEVLPDYADENQSFLSFKF